MFKHVAVAAFILALLPGTAAGQLVPVCSALNCSSDDAVLSTNLYVCGAGSFPSDCMKIENAKIVAPANPGLITLGTGFGRDYLFATNFLQLNGNSTTWSLIHAGSGGSSILELKSLSSFVDISSAGTVSLRAESDGVRMGAGLCKDFGELDAAPPSATQCDHYYDKTPPGAKCYKNNAGTWDKVGAGTCL